MSDSRLFIGIDTGTHTGLAVWDPEQQDFIFIDTLKIHKAMDCVRDLHQNAGGVTVIFEDARKRKYLPRERSMTEFRGRMMGAGSVKRDAVIWEDFLKDHGIPYEAKPPGKGMTKWSAETFKRVTGWTGRTSEHARDAAVLVFGRR